MISRRTRKTVDAVERLKYASIAAVKGIDEHASVLSDDSVLHLKNLRIDHDGGLVLRKPIAFKTEIPKVRRGAMPVLSDVVFSNYIFDNESLLVVRKSKDTQYIGVFKNGVGQTIRLTGYAWDDYSEVSWEFSTGDFRIFYSTDFLDFSNISVVNTSSSTIISNVLVNITSEIFKTEGKEYLSSGSTDLCYTDLYKDQYLANSKVVVPRTLIISKSTSVDKMFDLKIVTPDLNYITSAGDLALDTNLDLDNPYAIRDVYNTAAPTIQSIIPYVLARNANSNTISLYDSSNPPVEFPNGELSPEQNLTYSKNPAEPKISEVRVFQEQPPVIFFRHAACSVGYADIILQSMAGVFNVLINYRGNSISFVTITLTSCKFSGRGSRDGENYAIYYDIEYTVKKHSVPNAVAGFQAEYVNSPHLLGDLMSAVREFHDTATGTVTVYKSDFGNAFIENLSSAFTATFKLRYPVKENNTYELKEVVQEYTSREV